MCSIKAFTKPCGVPNLGGTSETAWVIAHEDITTWSTLNTAGTNPGDPLTYTGAFTLAATKNWQKLPIIPQSGSVENQMAGVTGSMGFTSEMMFNLAGASAAQKEFINSLLNVPVVVIMPDRSGEKHIIGDPVTPAYLMADGRFGTGKDPGDLRGAELKFSAAMGHLAYTVGSAVVIDDTP